MTFLNPAVLVGLFAAAIPVILHFINLRKIKRIEFSTLYFIKELKKNKIRNLKIKQWLLLLLRLLLIIFVVLAFAKPALENSSLGAFSEEAKKTIVIILDNSYSMSVKHNETSNFGAAKEFAKTIAEQAGVNDDVFLITTSPVVSYDKKRASKFLNGLSVNYVKGNLTEALRRAKNIFESRQTLHKEFFVLSDFQRSNADADELAKTKLPETVRVTAVRFLFGNVRNYAITNAKLNDAILFPGKTAEISFEAINTDDKFPLSKTFSLFADKERTAQTVASIAPGGTKKLRLRTPVKRAGVCEFVIAGEDDEIVFDNKRYIGVNVREKISVAVFARRKKDAKFVLDALDSRVSQLNEIDFIGTGKTAANAPNRNDILFAIGAPDEKLAENFLRAGKTVVIFPSKNSGAAFYKMLRKFGIADEAKIAATENFIAADKIKSGNPLISGLFSTPRKVEINSPQIKKYVKIKPNVNCEELVTLENDAPFLCTVKIFGGRVFFFAVAPDLTWSDFPFKPIFAPLLNRLAQYSVAGDVTIKNITVGEPFFVDIRKTALPRIKIEAPGKKEFFVRVDYNKNASHVKFEATYKPGFYYVFSGEKLIDKFTANTDVRESEEKFYDDSEIKKLLGEKITIADAGKISPAEISARGKGAELWRPFLALALLAALLEMYVARTAKKDFEEFANGKA